MKLTERQTELLKELINIGYGRSAAALSDLTGERITLEVPKVAVCGLDETCTELGEVFRGEVWSVNQVFSGTLTGHALLLVEEESARVLAQRVLGEQLPPQGRTAMREVLTEIGNILLQGALGICGDVLQIQVAFSVPGLRVDEVETLLSSMLVQSAGLQYALLVQTKFEIVTRQMSGYMVAAFGGTSFERLLEALDAWERREAGTAGS